MYGPSPSPSRPFTVLRLHQEWPPSGGSISLLSEEQSARRGYNYVSLHHEGFRRALLTLFARTTRSGLDSGALEPCSHWNAVANSLRFNPNAFQSVLSLLSRSTGHISDAEPHVECLFVAGEIGVFDQLLQDSSEHHDHVL